MPRSPGATLSAPLGRVAELADAQVSGTCVRKDVGVQVPPRPPWVTDVTGLWRRQNRIVGAPLGGARVGSGTGGGDARVLRTTRQPCLRSRGLLGARSPRRAWWRSGSGPLSLGHDTRVARRHRDAAPRSRPRQPQRRSARRVSRDHRSHLEPAPCRRHHQGRATRPARDALADRTHQLRAVELRAVSPAVEQLTGVERLLRLRLFGLRLSERGLGVSHGLLVSGK